MACLVYARPWVPSPAKGEDERREGWRERGKEDTREKQRRNTPSFHEKLCPVFWKNMLGLSKKLKVPDLWQKRPGPKVTLPVLPCESPVPPCFVQKPAALSFMWS